MYLFVSRYSYIEFQHFSATSYCILEGCTRFKKFWSSLDYLRLYFPGLHSILLDD